MVYAAKAEVERQACLELRKLYLTGSMYLKSKAALTAWSLSFIGRGRRIRVIIDECHRFSREQITAIIGEAQVAVLLGNYGQGPSASSMHVPVAKQSFAHLNDHGVKNISPLQWHPATAWARDQKSMHVDASELVAGSAT